MHLSMTGAHSLTECLTGKRWPVLIEGKHLALQRAYLAQRSRPGHPVRLAEARREPYLQLSNEGNQVRGFGGCSALSSGFEGGSDGFRFLRMAGPRRACPGDMMTQEARLLAALEATASRRIAGDTLQLRDGRGTVRVRLEPLCLR